MPVTAVKRCTRTPATIAADKKPNVVFTRARKKEEMPQQDVKKPNIFLHPVLAQTNRSRRRMDREFERSEDH
jgi:hypothetical protein